jgi:translation initiation factor 3 subunit I
MRPLVLKGHSKPIKDLLFNKENDLLLSASTDRLVTLWSAEYGERIGTYYHEAAVYSMSLTDDSKYLLTGDSIGGVYLWEANTGNLLKKIQMESKFSIRSVEFSGDHKQISFAYGGRTKDSESAVAIYSFNEILNAACDNKIIDVSKIKENVLIKSKNNDKISKAKWLNNDKNIIATTDYGYITKYDSSTGEEVLSSKIHAAPIMDLDVSPMEEILLSASKDGKSHIIDPDTFEIVETLHPQNPTRNINSCRISPLMSLDDEDKRRYHCFIAGGQESRDVTTTHAKKGGFELLIYHMMFGKELGCIQGHFGPINALAVSSDGYIVASGAEESSVRVQRLNYDEYFNLEK